MLSGPKNFFWGASPPNFCCCWGASPQILKYGPKDWILGLIVSSLRPRPLFWSWQHCLTPSLSLVILLEQSTLDSEFILIHGHSLKSCKFVILRKCFLVWIFTWNLCFRNKNIFYLLIMSHAAGSECSMFIIKFNESWKLFFLRKLNNLIIICTYLQVNNQCKLC